MNSTPHTTFTRVFFPERFAESEAGKAEVKRKAAEAFRGYLERLQQLLKELRFGVLQDHLSAQELLLDRFSVADAYLATVLNWAPSSGIVLAQWPAVADYH